LAILGREDNKDPFSMKGGASVRRIASAFNVPILILALIAVFGMRPAGAQLKPEWNLRGQALSNERVQVSLIHPNNTGTAALAIAATISPIDKQQIHWIVGVQIPNEALAGHITLWFDQEKVESTWDYKAGSKMGSIELTDVVKFLAKLCLTEVLTVQYTDSPAYDKVTLFFDVEGLREALQQMPKVATEELKGLRARAREALQQIPKVATEDHESLTEEYKQTTDGGSARVRVPVGVQDAITHKDSIPKLGLKTVFKFDDSYEENLLRCADNDGECEDRARRKFQQTALAQIEKCEDDYCKAAVMRKFGASNEAIEFSRLLDFRGFMTSFTYMGRVSVAQVRFTGRINDDKSVFLVNGSPPLMDVAGCGMEVEDHILLKAAGIEDTENCLAKIDITKHPLYEKLTRQSDDAYAIERGHKPYERPAIWGGHATFRQAIRLQDGGQRFIIAFEILSCHSCPSAGFAEIAYDFNETGHFLGTSLVDLKRIPGLESTPTTPAVVNGIAIGSAAEFDIGTDLPDNSEYGRRIQSILSRNYRPPLLALGTTEYAVIVLRVARSGEILSLSGGHVSATYFKRKSQSALVNSAVERAVIASNPLPAFPSSFLPGVSEAVAEIWFQCPK
jgi:hypothetical protein